MWFSCDVPNMFEAEIEYNRLLIFTLYARDFLRLLSSHSHFMSLTDFMHLSFLLHAPLLARPPFVSALEVAAKLKLRGANAEDLWPRILTFDALAEEHLTLALKYKSTNGGKGDDDDEDDEEDEGLSVGLGVVKAERPPPERLRGKPVPSEGRLARLASQRIAFERRRTAAASPSSSTSAVEGGSGNFHQQMVPSNRRRRASSARMASNASMSASGQRAPTGAMVEMKTAPGAAEEAARDNIIIEDDDQGFDWKIVAKGELEVLQLTKVAIPAVLLEIRDNGPRLKTWQKKKPK